MADVLVVSSDKLVRRRCSEGKSRAASGLRLRFETGEAFRLLLPAASGDGAVLAPFPPSARVADALADAPPVEELAQALAQELAPAARADGASESAAGGGALAEYLAWVQREQPGPVKSAADVARGGGGAQRGTKRKGVYR